MPEVTPGTVGGSVGVYYIHADQVNTARVITNAAGTKVWEADADPFGANLPNENPAGHGTFVYNPRFPGQYYDRETGLHYNYHRDYDPQTGRYIQSDPIGLAGGINTYAYVEGDPLSFSDPYGLARGRLFTGLAKILVKAPKNTFSGKRMGHIFRDKEGHLPNTLENRQLLERLANDPAKMLGKDKHGNEWCASTRPDGTQVWTELRNGEIINGGVNATPRPFNPETGLKAPKPPGW